MFHFEWYPRLHAAGTFGSAPRRLLRLLPPLPQLQDTLLDSLFHTTIGGLIKHVPRQRLRQALHFGYGVLEPMCMLIALAVSPLLHRTRRGIAKMQRDRI